MALVNPYSHVRAQEWEAGGVCRWKGRRIALEIWQEGRKTPPVQIRDGTDISILCACLSLAEGECLLLGVAVLSHPHELTLLSSPPSLPTLGLTSGDIHEPGG